MRDLTSFDHIAIASELSDLGGRFFQKFSRIERGYKIKLRGADILYIPPEKIYETGYSVPALDPDNLSMKIRKELQGLRLQNVQTLNLDRVLLLDFGERKLIFEMFREGNIVLTSDEGEILALLRGGRWRHRTLEVGVMYNTPPPPAIAEGRIDLRSTLQRDLVRSGIPKPYANEIIHRMGLKPDAPSSEVSERDIVQVLEDILNLLRSPSGFLCDGEPFPMKMSYLTCSKETDKFSDLLDRYTPTLIQTQEKKTKEKPKKIEYMLKSLQDIDREIEEISQILNEIYEHWNEIDQMLRTRTFTDIGKLRFKGVRGKEAVFDFTP